LYYSGYKNIPKNAPKLYLSIQEVVWRWKCGKFGWTREREGGRDDGGDKTNWNDAIGLMVKYLLTLYLKEEVTDENNKTGAVMRIER
jgi:hypothetical protein